MKKVDNSLIINKLHQYSGGVKLLSMYSHTLSPRQAGMACLGFFLCLSLRAEWCGVWGLQPTPIGQS